MFGSKFILLNTLLYMKKIILFWFVSTICAAVMYVIGLRDENLANLTFAVGCVAYGIPSLGIIMCLLLFHGIEKDSVYDNFIFSWFIIVLTATVQYAILYKATVNWPLYYSIPTALISGLLFIWLMDYVRKGLHSVSG